MKVVYSRDARKQLKKLDHSIKVRILDYMDQVSKLDNPRDRGTALVGNYIGLWRYRVGDYRILCDINDDEICILVVDVGHRRDVYSGK